MHGDRLDVDHLAFILRLVVADFRGRGSGCVPVAQLVEHRAVMREVVSLTLAGPTLRVLK